MKIRTFSDPNNTSASYSESKKVNTNVSNNIGNAEARTSYQITMKPGNGKIVRFISVICLKDGEISDTTIDAKFENDAPTDLPNSTSVIVTVGGEEKTYTYNL